MNTFDNGHWIENFRMDKTIIARLCDRLRPLVCKQDTRYLKVVLVEVQVCIYLYKPT